MNNIYTLDIHEAFMSHALELAKKGRGHVSPNPMVGCVLVKDGEIIGEGYHEKYGDSHAEVMAIRNSRMDPQGATAYINLEPCCTEGNTPPCTLALKENGISEVFVGMLDPNPKVNGKGIDYLERSGISTHVGVLEDESRELNLGFEKWITQSIPFVIAKVAQTVDGFMGIDSSTSIWLTGDASKVHTHKLRSKVDAILIGRQTALIDNPSLTVRKTNGINPIRIVLDTNRTLPLSLKLFNDNKARTINLCSNEKFNNGKTHFCEYLCVPESKNMLEPDNILKALGEEGITSLLIEGGQRVLKSFFVNDLIDKVYIYTSSKKLQNAELENPLLLTDDWDIISEESLENDSLVVAKKGEKCLQVL